MVIYKIFQWGCRNGGVGSLVFQHKVEITRGGCDEASLWGLQLTNQIAHTSPLILHPQQGQYGSIGG